MRKVRFNGRDTREITAVKDLNRLEAQFWKQKLKRERDCGREEITGPYALPLSYSSKRGAATNLKFFGTANKAAMSTLERVYLK